MLKQIALAAFAATALFAVAPSANAFPGFCDDDWGCGMNGASHQGIQVNGLTAGSGETVVDAVILPTGETINLR
jgi:hypothetical protein